MSEYTRFFEGSDRDFARAQTPAELVSREIAGVKAALEERGEKR